MPYLGSTYIGGTLQATQSITAPTFIGALTGNASTATTLATSRTISLSGDATGSANFNGGANAAITVTLSNSGVTAGSYGSTTVIPVITVDSKGRITSISTSAMTSYLPLTGGTLTGPLTINKSVAGDGGWDDCGIILKNNNATAGEAAISWQTISTGSNYWIQGLNQSAHLKFAYGSSFSDAASLLVLDTSGQLWNGNLANKYWHAGNDGTGSGLDADLLDGNHASSFYLASNPNGYTTNTGTVTSVAMTVPTGLSISGTPITTSGTLALTLTSGYSIPTTTKQGQWDTAYTNTHTSGSDNQTITSGNGMNFTTGSGNVTITLGTPSGLTAGTTDVATAKSHTHSIATASAVALSNSSTSTAGASTSLARADHTHAISGFALTGHTHSTYDRASSVLSGSSVFSNITVVDGIVTGTATRNLTKADISLGNVENTALSTWAGTSSITTVGTLTSGTIPWTLISNPPSTYAPSSHTLGSHGDVTITSNSSGEILKWNGTAWVNNTLTEAGIQATVTGAATTITSSNLAASKALISNSSGKVAVSAVTSTELGYLVGVESSLQTQINDLVASAEGVVTYRNTVTIASPANTIDTGILNLNAANDALLAFENDIYILKEGIDYTVSGTNIVAVSDNFVAGTYTFIVFKNKPLSEFTTNDLTDHIAATAVHGATSAATANSIARRDASGDLHANNVYASGDLHANNVYASGDLHANKVYNAVWNDIADFVEVDDSVQIEYGCAYIREDDTVKKAYKKNQRVLGIASDTYGFGIGKKEAGKKQIPIAIGGWVLAYVDKVYPFGTALTTNKEGILTKASVSTKIFRGEAIVASFDRIEKNNTWNGIHVQGRHWVKVI